MWRFNLINTIADQANWIISSDVAIVIADKYPKAQHHYLVLPKAEISSVFNLTREHLPLLEELHLLARNVVEVRGQQWNDFKVGFHAEPSLERVHLHVISQDFVSPCLKRKKHWTSFNTALFVPYEELRDKLQSENSFQRLPPHAYHKLLDSPLQCNQCERICINLPKLKEHLLEHLLNKSDGQQKSVIYTKIETSKDKINIMDVTEKNKIKMDHIKQNIRNELRKKILDKNHILIESDRAVVVKADYPKAQYHFRVVAKEDIEDVTKLTSDHLPLLDHMMELAVQIIGKQDHLPSRNFRIGFKADPFWDRLNMHVISDDFYSLSMKRIKHWNSFNTELFLPFQQAYMMLDSEGAIETLSEVEFQKLKEQTPLHCNQCDFQSPLLLALKAHLFTHWQDKESERRTKKQMEDIVKLLDEAKLEDTAKPEAASSREEHEITASTSQKSMDQNQPVGADANAYHQCGPLVNLMNLQHINNPFRNTPARFGIAAKTHPQPTNSMYAPRPHRAGNPLAYAPRPQQGGNPFRNMPPRPQLGGNRFGPHLNRFGPQSKDMRPMFAAPNQQPRFGPKQPQNQRPRAPNQPQNQRPRGPNQPQNQGTRAPNQSKFQ
ncbi:aprataxin-like protein [Drosophila pseudoobscura]|uniref:Aprataxin-like protein n=1 Tax=Drosophila pseudoobscura pseudoobscura TaxID=46245 RepID=A0A6I8V6I7_DROPS|nr:aprataxin-like protein [Drosophila pseudoobscura]